MTVGTVSELWHYPIKSLRGETRPTLQLDRRGVVGDRMLAVTNAEGKFGSGKSTRRFRRMDGLLQLQAREMDGQVMVDFPDGRTYGADDPAFAAELSNLVEQPVTLQTETHIPHFDVTGIHILTTSSLRWLQNRLPTANVDARRFRPNIVADTNDFGPVEFDWVGKEIQVGNAVLTIVAPAERCVMTTMPQGDLSGDADILRCIAQQLDANFGVYAEIVTPGDIKVGDPLHIRP